MAERDDAPRPRGPSDHAPHAPLPDAEFASFLADVAREVERRVDPWRVRLGEVIARWQRDGVRTDVLERALQLPAEPDVDGLVATFDAAVARLAAVERAACASDPSLAGHAAFRDPARVPEAEALLAAARRAPRRAAPGLETAAPAAPPLELDPETFVGEWPELGALLLEAYR
jgi:hypothetical protein